MRAALALPLTVEVSLAKALAPVLVVRAFLPARLSFSSSHFRWLLPRPLFLYLRLSVSPPVSAADVAFALTRPAPVWKAPCLAPLHAPFLCEQVLVFEVAPQQRAILRQKLVALVGWALAAVASPFQPASLRAERCVVWQWCSCESSQIYLPADYFAGRLSPVFQVRWA